MGDASGDWALRALREEELDKWLDHLAAAFAEKGTPREYFQGHFERDPWRTVQGIRVCVSSSDEIGRQMFVNGAALAFGGIGEVATSKSLRGKGLAPRVLEDCIKYMEESGFALAVLHTSQPALQQYYAKSGFTTVRMPYVRCETTKAAALDGSAGASCSSLPERVTSSSDAVASILAELSQIYAYHAPGFNGTVLRDSPAYWRDWILDDCTKPNTSLWTLRSSEQKIQAYLAIRIRTNTTTHEQSFEVREFFSLSEDTKKGDFGALLHAALQHHSEQLQDSFKIVTHEGLVPRSWIPCTSAEVFADNGWMYRVLRGEKAPADVTELLVGKENEREGKHFLSTLDSF